MGRPDYIFGQFTMRCRDVQDGDRVCCAFAPQLVIRYNCCLNIFLTVVSRTFQCKQATELLFFTAIRVISY